LLKYGQSYVEQGIEAYDKKYNETRIKNLKKYAAKLGFEVIKAVPLLETVS